ncbi:aldolase [Ensifer sp. HO-A22]|uniref:Aldolase n=1 Tax=Ensifer oleiphilus TaxID=2742698 RepID=A0A7Y6UPY4_9HYPH|nr:aldolase [Ensifer oleiphilus]NVD41133.1 aldolase [Ensifer oleiphilus]
MSVNRFKTMKPLLLQSAEAPIVKSAVLGPFDGLIVDHVFDGDALARPARMVKNACRIFARIPPINRVTEDELFALLRNDIDGVVLAGCRNRADVQRLDVMLRVAEASTGSRPQKIAILAEYGAIPESVLSPCSLHESSPRLEGLVFDGQKLAAATGCEPLPVRQDQVTAAPVAAGRAATVLRAHEAGLACYDVLPQTAMTEIAVRQAFAASRADGFSSVVCRSPEQAAWLKIDA